MTALHTTPLPTGTPEPGGIGEPLAPVLQLVPAHEHTWALRDTEYDNGFTLNRFECDGCAAVRFT